MKNNQHLSNGRGGKRERAGRKRGVPNKLTGQVKEMILAALDDAGGVDYLTEQAEQNPAAFMTLLGKVLPLQVSGDCGAALVVEIVRASDPNDNERAPIAAASPHLHIR
jgi:hypothetical protein